MQRYRESGNTALGTYCDKDRPADVVGQLASLLPRVQLLPVATAELTQYLLAYPDAVVPPVESLFYWEKIAFGLKATLRVNHALAYRSSAPGPATWVVAVKQLYASHYFRAALDLAACVADGEDPGASGFYLISLKASTQDGLTGLRGSLMRRVIVSRTRSAQEKALMSIRNALESHSATAGSREP